MFGFVKPLRTYAPVLNKIGLNIQFLPTVLTYTVSHNIVYTFGLLVSWPPKPLEVPSWTFFNSPLLADFKTIIFVIIWCNFDRDIAKILKGSHSENPHFLFITKSRT